MPGGPSRTADQCKRSVSESGWRERRAGEGEERWDFSSARRRFVAVGVGEAVVGGGILEMEVEELGRGGEGRV